VQQQASNLRNLCAPSIVDLTEHPASISRSATSVRYLRVVILIQLVFVN
jgi:hypothetical protein